MIHSLSSLVITLSSLHRLSQDYRTLFRWQQSPVGSAHSYSCCCWNSTMLVAAFGFVSRHAQSRTTFNTIAPNFTNKRFYHITLHEVRGIVIRLHVGSAFRLGVLWLLATPPSKKKPYGCPTTTATCTFLSMFIAQNPKAMCSVYDHPDAFYMLCRRGR